MSLFHVLRRIAPTAYNTVCKVCDDAFDRLDTIIANTNQTAQTMHEIKIAQEHLATEVANNEKKNQIYLELLYRQDGESPYDARRRMFASIPPAEGLLRLQQLANARLMQELHTICSELQINYWFAYGTLVAALSRHGSIPWDDDIDICMMREDIEKLRAHLEGNPDYHITVMYDRYVMCKQVRFSSTNPLLPCFIDLSIWDYATEATREKDDIIRRARLNLMADFASMDNSDYWREFPCLYAPGSGDCVQLIPTRHEEQDSEQAAKQILAIEALFDKYMNQLHEANVICDAGEGSAVAYSIDNIYDAPWRAILWDIDLFLPTRLCPYEDFEFNVPNKAEEVMQECYPGSPYLPGDIVSHEHFVRLDHENNETKEALLSFINQ